VVIFDWNKDERLTFASCPVQVGGEDDLILNQVVDSIAQQGYQFDGNILFYFDAANDFYVFCGSFPLAREVRVPLGCLHNKVLSAI